MRCKRGRGGLEGLEGLESPSGGGARESELEERPMGSVVCFGGRMGYGFGVMDLRRQMIE